MSEHNQADLHPYTGGEPFPERVDFVLRGIENATLETDQDDMVISPEDAALIDMAGADTVLKEKVQRQIKDLVLTLPPNLQSSYIQHFTNLDKVNEALLFINQNLNVVRQDPTGKPSPVYRTLEEVRKVLLDYKKNLSASAAKKTLHEKKSNI